LNLKLCPDLLDLLARRRVIDWEEKRILDSTLIGGKTLKEISGTPISDHPFLMRKLTLYVSFCK